MARAGAIFVALALLLADRGASAQCLDTAAEFVCGGVTFSAADSELSEGVFRGTDVIGVLPNGDVLRAGGVETRCLDACSFTDVLLSGSADSIPLVHVDSAGVSTDAHDVLSFGQQPRAGIAAAEFRWADETAVVGVGVLAPVDARRAVGAVAAGGPNTLAVGARLFAGPDTSSQIDVSRAFGDTGYLISAAERLELGPVTLSLDGTLGNHDGRDFFAGSQTHSGLGREELVVGLSAGDSRGLVSLRYVATRGASETRDEVLLDGIAHADFGRVTMSLEIGAGAAATESEFAPSLGTLLTMQSPIGGNLWSVVPRASIRVVGEESAELLELSRGTDSAGAAAGSFFELTPVRASSFELRLQADVSYGGLLSAGDAEMHAWNRPTDGWRVAGGVEAVMWQRALIRWLAERQEQDVRGTQALRIDAWGDHSWAATELRLSARGYEGAWATVGAGTDRLQARFVALEGQAGRERAPVVGPLPLRSSRGDFSSESGFAMAVGYRVQSVHFDAEAAYSSSTLRGARFGGVGRIGFQRPEAEWGLNALVGSLVGRGEIYAGLGLQLGRHPGLSGWHRR